MTEVFSSWTLLWFMILNIATLGLVVVYWLFEKKSKGGK